MSKNPKPIKNPTNSPEIIPPPPNPSPTTPTTPTTPPPDADKKKQYKKIERYELLTAQHKFVNFKGQTLYRTEDYVYRPLTSQIFASLAYQVHPGALVQQIKELEHMVRATSPDASHLSHRIALTADLDWDTRTLTTVPVTDPTSDAPTIYRTLVPPSSDPDHLQAARTFLLQLANDDPLLADDMLQAIAPLFMEKKPAGVIWFVGTGANGKSALINAIYRLVGPHLASLTVAAIEDGRDAPRLNGMMGNVCRESSESRVDDTERYKAIGTHEEFDVHKFHSQDMITITGDLHHIFNANNIPVFGDKTQGARRRTLIVPFPARFKDDPTFEDRTFTPHFLGGLLQLILDATHIIRDNGYQYRFSPSTIQAKASYDSEVNSAEAFFAHLEANNVAAFTNYEYLMSAYQSWCHAEGLIPLGITNLRRTIMTQGKVERKTVRLENGKMPKWWFFNGETVKPSDLVSLEKGGLDIGIHVKSRGKDNPVSERLRQTVLSEDKEWFN